MEAPALIDKTEAIVEFKLAILTQTPHAKTPAHHDSVRGFQSGAGEMNRTPDLLITNELLYRLSYTGVSPRL
jgi:hypothetical protein